MPIGGYFFEVWLEGFSPYSTNRLFRSLNRDRRQDERKCLQNNANLELIEKCQAQFLGFLMFSTNSVGTGARKQLFFQSFVLQFYGLSLKGMSILARLGMASTRTFFDDQLCAILKKSDDCNRYYSSIFKSPFTQLYIILQIKSHILNFFCSFLFFVKNKSSLNYTGRNCH